MNEHVEDLLALYALGGLEPSAAARVEAHLAHCAACMAQARQEQTLAAAIAASVPPLSPPPRLREQVLARARGLAARRGDAPAPRWLALPRWVVAGLSLVLAILTGWNVYLTRQVDNLQRQLRWSNGAVALMSAPTTQEIALAGQGGAAGASGFAYVDESTQDVVLVVQHLDPLAAGQTYQAWLITARGPVSAGLFDVTDTGWGMLWLDAPYTPGSAIGVSREPAGGSQAPGEVVLLGGM